MKKYSIKCPNCAAPLDVMGGKNIESIVCQYCGSVIDLNNEYKIVSKFNKIVKKLSPFELGMQGVIKGVEYTIIGIVAYDTQKRDNIGPYSWIDYMLYSPTHGYAWLTYESGILIFSRRTRLMPSIPLNKLSTAQKTTFNGKSFKFYESYRAYVIYAVGSLNYVAKKNDLYMVYDAISPPYGLTLEIYRDKMVEMEYSLSEYMKSEDIYKAFGVKNHPKEPDIHQLKPYDAPIKKAISTNAFVFFILSVLIILAISIFYGGKEVAKGTFYTNKFATEFQSSGNHILEIDLVTSANNNWAYYNIDIINSSGKLLYSIGKEISYYHGYEGGEYWSEGSRDTSIYIKSPPKGKYTLKVSVEWKRPLATALSLKDGVVRSIYFVILAVLFGVLSLIYPIAKYSYNAKVWKRVEEDEDD